MEQKPTGQMYNVESIRKDEEYVGKKNCGIWRAFTFAMDCMMAPETIEVSIRSVRTRDRVGSQEPVETYGQPLTLRRDIDGNWFAEW